MMEHRRSSSTSSILSSQSYGMPVTPSSCDLSPAVSLQPPIPAPVKMSSNNTFVHKLYNMVVDVQYQHLIAWNYTGSSFIVCNIMEFSRDVLPKHFKHNNFSSFVRQLNMYGFHKVNKSPRGHRTLAENQIWEFSHPKFLRGRPDMLDDIKRKAMENDSMRRDNGDLSTHMAMMQVAQSDMLQQLAQLQENFSEVVRELAETKRKQGLQQQQMKSMMNVIQQHSGSQIDIPPELNFENFELKADPERPPPIFITSPDSQPTGNMLQNLYFNSMPSDSHSSSSSLSHHTPQRPSTPLTVQTHNLVRSPHHHNANLNITIPSNFMINDMQSNSISPNSLSAYHNTNTLPPSPSPSSLMSDDDASSLYSPHSPHTPSNPSADSSSSDYRQSNDSSSLHPMHHSGQFTFSLSHNMS
ncbi:unnamed protein product [Umbelopsis ramanniana]